MRHFLRTRVFAPPAAVAALAFGVTVPAASRVLIPASRRTQRFTPSGAAATCSAIALAPVAARADEHLAPASGTEKQSGIVHCSPRRGGLDDPRSPGNTALGAVRKCGSGRSLGRDRQVNVVRGCAGLPGHSDLTPTAERRHRTGAPRRHLLIGNIGSGGRQRQAPGRGTGTIQSSSAPIRQSQFTRAVRRITALSQSRQQGVASPGTMRDLCDVLGQLRPEPRPEGDESVLGELRLTDTEYAAVEVDIVELKPGDLGRY